NHAARGAQANSLERGIKTPAAASRRPPARFTRLGGRGRGAPYTGRRSLDLRRAGSDRHLGRVRRAVPGVGDADLVAGLLGGDSRGQIVRARDRLAAEGRDHIAGLQPGLVGGRAAANRGNLSAALVRGRPDRDAEVRVADLLALDELRDDLGDRVRRNGEPNALIAATVALDLRGDADNLAGH